MIYHAREQIRLGNGKRLSLMKVYSSTENMTMYSSALNEGDEGVHFNRKYENVQN